MTQVRLVRRWPGNRPASDREAGAAMIVAVMVITVVAVLGTSVAVIATRSTHAAGESRTAGVVKDLANAGLAEGVTYLRQTGVTPAIDAQSPIPDGDPNACVVPTPVPAASSTPAWTKTSPAFVDSGSQGDYMIWIEKVAAASPTAPSAYRVCGEGTSGQGKRTASVVAEYTPAGGTGGPYAVYTKGHINLQSSAQRLSNISAYSEDCIDRKHNTQTIGGTDLATNRPAAAHSMLWVLGDNGNVTCDAVDSVHRGNDFVNEMFPYDTDRAGGPVGGDPHRFAASDPNRETWLNGTPWSGTTDEPDGQTVAQFRAKWGVPDMLGTESITALEQRARQQGNYYSLSSADLHPSIYLSAVSVPNEPHAVVFLDFPSRPNRDVDLDLPFTTQWEGWTCPTGKSLIIVVRNADVTANGNGVLRASVIVKNGEVKQMNGTFSLVGGLFADNGLDLSGTANVQLDTCAIQNPPPGGNPQVEVSNYVEYDRG